MKLEGKQTTRRQINIGKDKQTNVLTDREDGQTDRQIVG